MEIRGDYKSREFFVKDYNLFFTSDTHFWSERALELSKRPFGSVQEMNETMLKNINDTCKASDGACLIHLGDFGAHDFVRQIDAPVMLILGNYEIKEMEEGFNGDYKAYRSTLMNQFGYADVALRADIITNTTNPILRLYHDPKDCVNNINSDDFRGKHLSDVFYLFGHIHGRQMVKRFGIDVGVDAHHFRPISLNDVWFYENAIRNHYDDSVWC